MGDSAPPPPQNGHFLPKKGLKMPILGQKQCFLGLGGQFKAPPPYFAGARLKKKTCVAGYGSRKMCESGPPPPKNGQFLPKKRPKNANFGTKTVFFGLGWSVQGPRTLFRRFSTQKNICCRVREPENGFRAAPPPPPNGHFLPKKRPKNANFGPKTILFGLGCPFQGPPPYFADARLKKTCVAGYGSRKMGDSAPPPQNGHFLPKKSLKMPILGQKQCFLGTGWPFQGPPSLFRTCSTQKNMCCRVRDPENR